MDSLQKIKEDLKLNKDLSELVDTLKQVAIAEFRALEKKKERFADFMKILEGFFGMTDFSDIDHPLTSGKGKLALIMVTSDEGFMGGLNIRVINAALSYPGAEEASLIILGQHGSGYLRSRGRNFKSFPGIVSEKRYEMALQIRDYVLRKALAGDFGRLVLFYPHPVSFTVQKVEQVEILPCQRALVSTGAEDQVPPKDLLLESSISDLTEYLAGLWMTQKFFEAFEESKLAEYSARTVHLEESYQTLLRSGKAIRRQYFHTHHEIIDRGIRDMFSALIIRRKSKKKNLMDG